MDSPRIKTILQKKLTAECWMVQAFGTTACESCEFKDADECGGQEIRKTGRNEKGYVIGTAGL